MGAETDDASLIITKETCFQCHNGTLTSAHNNPDGGSSQPTVTWFVTQTKGGGGVTEGAPRDEWIGWQEGQASASINWDQLCGGAG